MHIFSVVYLILKSGKNVRQAKFCLRMYQVILARLYASTGRAIALTPASTSVSTPALRKRLRFCLKFYKSISREPEDGLARYWSEFLCCTIVTHLGDLEVNVTDFESYVNVFDKVLRILYLLNMWIDLSDNLPPVRYWSDFFFFLLYHLGDYYASTPAWSKVCGVSCVLIKTTTLCQWEIAMFFVECLIYATCRLCRVEGCPGPMSYILLQHLR